MINLNVKSAFGPIALLCLCLFSSCDTLEHENNGYPETVHFSAEGGTQTVSGDCSFASMSLYLGNDFRGGKVVNDSIVASYGWLIVKTKSFSNELEITALPSNQKKRRKMEIEGYFGWPEYAVIKVYQDGK